MSYKFDKKYGPFPNKNGEINLSYYFSKYVKDYYNISGLPEENKEYLDEVFRNYIVTNTSYMFFGCRFDNLDILSDLNMSNVTNMHAMFYMCENIKKLNLSNWITEKVKDMSYMFWGCSSLEDLKISTWNTRNVIDMGFMFCWCKSLNNLDISGWDTSNVKDMHFAFNNCKNLINITGIIDFSSCKENANMFYNDTKLKNISVKFPNGKNKNLLLSTGLHTEAKIKVV